MWDWIGDHKVLMTCLGILSVLTFFGSVLAVPFFVARIPADYFLEDRPRTEALQGRHPIIRWLFLIGKNLLGLLLIVGGLSMLVLPGQGVLTLVIGMTLINFPGKRDVERWILKRPSVEKVVNWIRRRAGRDPLRFPPTKRTLGMARQSGPHPS